MKGLPHYQHDALGQPAAGLRKPLILFLHGRGECGDNIALVRKHGPPKLFPAHGLDRFIVLAPQCPTGQTWNEAHLEALTRAAIQVYPVEEQRIYATGLSMGGVGIWDLATRCPQLFAAIAPLCGDGDPGRANNLVNPRLKPIWLFHSAADAVISVQGSDSLFQGLCQVRAEVTYTRYNSLTHVGTWERAYDSALLYDWFLQQPR